MSDIRRQTFFIGGPSISAAILKFNSDETVKWQTVLSLNPTLNSMAIDNGEQNIYIAVSQIPTNIVRLSITTGAIVDS